MLGWPDDNMQHPNLTHSLAANVSLLKARASRNAIQGALIASVAIVLATLLVGYQQFGEYTLANLIEVQTSYPVLWLLDSLPFVFGLWGQYASGIMAYEAGALIADQTSELRDHAASLASRAAYHTTHDHLTELPNRVLFSDRARQALGGALRGDHRLAILILGLHDFKEINSSLGHYNGDRLLKEVAHRLKGVVRGTDTVARLGGDEFGILLPRIEAREDSKCLARKLVNALETPFEIDGVSIGIQSSIGIALHPYHGSDADALLQCAHVAMTAARRQNSGIVVYDSGLERHSAQHLALLGELRQAINRSELLLHFQPKVDLSLRRLSGVEALVRWQHIRRGFIGPDTFIPLAERTGLIKPMTHWVLNEALRQQGQWRKAGLDMAVAVNLSVHNLLDSDLPDVVAGMLASHQVPPERLTLEITESAMMHEPERTMEILQQLNAMGVRLSIDDFGTGYSSLAYLSRLPVTEIKIDKSFVMTMDRDDNNVMIVRTTIDLAHNLNLKVVAEGVENEQTQERLAEMGCDCIQGYHIARPMPADNLSGWIEDGRWRPPMTDGGDRTAAQIYPFKQSR
ncbi:MAG TPA: bifunctional diguanylate cyclase/phosphodiesterase [Gammaproteobacteria bacterium]|nr:bifunctional diguanylate cyclase/phosphodiesterase [Gammaproteobacteria bacterium]